MAATSSILHYGNLYVLGYNGASHFLNGKRRKSKITLNRRLTANVEYSQNDSKDLFQIGRSHEATNDFIVLNTKQGNKTASKKQTTVPRFACRIVVDRFYPYVARIYAGGYNAKKQIYLGENAPMWEENGELDGITSNGVYIMHMPVIFSCSQSIIGPNKGLWREVSMKGHLFTSRPLRNSAMKGSLLQDEENVLQDWTFIDLCGVTLVWRSAEGLAKSLAAVTNDQKILDLSAQQVFSCKNQKLFAFTKCGHVQEYQHFSVKHGACPYCGSVGPVLKVCFGMEPAFFVDICTPNFAFSCGHLVTEMTGRFWSAIGIPHGKCSFVSECPFCVKPLDGNLGGFRVLF